MIMRAAQFASRAALTGSLAGLMACANGMKAAPVDEAPAKPDYRETEVTLMGGDLVQVRVALAGDIGQEAVDAYARCAVTGYALANGAAYARHVRTVTDKEGSVWRADAVYSVTADKPEGLMVIEAATAVADCDAQEIPTGPKA